MIGFLRGKIAYLLADYCLIDVGGVGYRVFITGSTRNKLQLGAEATIFTHTSVREDAILLYGFATQEEYNLFQLLITVSGIGPKVALGVLSAITPDKLCQAIAKKQTTLLTKLPGIGKKSAERLILELKDKISLTTNVNYLNSDEYPTDEGLFDTTENIGTSIFAEGAAALKSLGYTQQEISPVLKRIEKKLAKEARTSKGGVQIANGKPITVQTIITLALKEFANN